MYIKKAGRILLILFLINAVLVSTHKGEFWPFSIYPMFSMAGKPWTRAILRDVTEVPDSLIWQTHDYPDLPGLPISTIEIGVDQIDYSNFVCKTKNWDEKRLEALRYMIGEDVLGDRKFLAIKVSGRLVGDDSVEAKALPFILMDQNKFLLNQSLDKSAYYSDESN
ncbi:hypothetical protein BFP72_17095 [Reichenbachiella sp. 5M10]|uniref:hypothetical protein n=1 Tax=Reichenbachiella sp. 5M10 TaxID=1889772 RepID=UPI000C144D2C|nr:hypothetical protein [Reichenbachiella sp. 5M10]PIB36995.1 hypothetical protein BFP72_17095 [Reichenbachiella sp. 5M10]